MFEQIEKLALDFGISVEMVVLAGIAVGSLMLFVGVASILTQRDPAAVRLANIAEAHTRRRKDRGILKTPVAEATGIMRSFLPADLAARTELHRKLAQAGHTGPNTLRNFTLVRITLGLALPAWLLLMVFAGTYLPDYLPQTFSDWIGSFAPLRIFQILTILVASGYYLPMLWLNGRVSERQQRITEGFPNALDMMQISVEAGLGFDAAMTRVGNELTDISPEIAYEFLSVQHQVQAGRPRQAAMRDMAERTGVDIVTSFANVVHQSMQFGTSMSEALTTYANEMRDYRQLRAQEMANKLPVKLSGVMASLMLPALILLTVGPTVIRYINMTAG
jgi:tight adherence protein C